MEVELACFELHRALLNSYSKHKFELEEEFPVKIKYFALPKMLFYSPLPSISSTFSVITAEYFYHEFIEADKTLLNNIICFLLDKFPTEFLATKCIVSKYTPPILRKSFCLLAYHHLI